MGKLMRPVQAFSDLTGSNESKHRLHNTIVLLHRYFLQPVQFGLRAKLCFICWVLFISQSSITQQNLEFRFVSFVLECHSWAFSLEEHVWSTSVGSESGVSHLCTGTRSSTSHRLQALRSLKYEVQWYFSWELQGPYFSERWRPMGSSRGDSLLPFKHCAMSRSRRMS